MTLIFTKLLLIVSDTRAEKYFGLHEKSCMSTNNVQNMYFYFNNEKVKVKVNQSHYRPGVTQRVPGS